MHLKPLFLTTLVLVLFLGCGNSDTPQDQTSSQDLNIPITIENRAFTSTHFSGSDNCAACHNGITDTHGEDVSIESAWSATMMANSAKDPLWKAKVVSEIKRNPHLEDVINDKCSKCHAPMANHEARSAQEEIKIFDDGFLNSTNPHYDETMNGVSCTLCHQVKEVAELGTLAGFSGNYSIGSDRIVYGQYNNVATQPMIGQVNYTPQFGAHISQSKMCATCHNLKTPYVNADGIVLSDTPESEFPEQMPYSEWEHSEFATTQSCQDCHMQRAEGVIISNRPTWLNTQRGNFAKHTFVGGNALMLDILNNNKTSLGVPSTTDFSKTLSKTTEILESAADIHIANNGMIENTLYIDVTISSNTGHKLPTSFPSRRAFVHFILYDTNGNILFESGKSNNDGSISGADADTNIHSYEPHYNIITSQDQVQIYEAVMHNSDNQVTYTLLRAASYVKDNRILPRGFDKATAPSDIAVQGEARNDVNFVGGSDTISYNIDTTNFTSTPARVEVALRYQTLSYPFAQDLFSEETNESMSFEGMYDASQMKTSTITSQALEL
ncbi:MAG: hypothetical protein J7J31_02765 [Helicobacteraceae bacterium]|nr:hypothetical protein [Helicobacteraceae bacterium]